MTRLRVKHFGPIRDGVKNDGWIEFKRVTVFVGNQGSGKSTLAKLYSTFSWIEKALVRGDHDKAWFEEEDRLSKTFLVYHRLENYITAEQESKTKIEYEGEAYTIKYSHRRMHIAPSSSNVYQLPQIMYVPAERNFISYVSQPQELRLSSASLKEFLVEFNYAKENMIGHLSLPINNAKLDYDHFTDTLSVQEADYKLNLADASSGFQSAVPLHLVSQYLANRVKERIEDRQESMSIKEIERFRKEAENIFSDALTTEQKRVLISTLSSRFNKTAFINIVEELEQNLYPESQWKVLQSLLQFNSLVNNNRLILTTHSPYVVNYLTIAVQGKHIQDNITRKNRLPDLLPKLAKIIPLHALIDSTELTIYQANEKTGSIEKLPNIDGIPSDNNFLNLSLSEGNDLFDRLLDIQEELEA
ncbi:MULTISPECIES: AAA family ATPase [Pseudomonas]|jgi:predicted ATPase|uniref:AAA family ATPase n=1 Tax=Pseudomonas germanica TaxID=2815720 RepID=UPI002A4E2BBE|nr:AAA family ATPase [Pseudomonas germanica]WPN76871.1 AAA family ATPase [Pseudomonas germanica]